MERIRAAGIESAYGRKRVLCGVDISAKAGQCVGIVGANGCGKSTLFHILSGLRRADGGTVFFDGRAAGGKLFLQYTGYVPQESNLIPELTVWDNLLIWYKDKNSLSLELDQGFLHMLGLEEMISLKAGKLSGGMKKRVSIGCAMAGNPPILLLDEPGAALDLPGRAEVKKYLELYKKAGGTILLATHEESDLEICDRVCALIAGKCEEIDRSLRGEALMKALQSGNRNIVTKGEE